MIAERRAPAAKERLVDFMRVTVHFTRSAFQNYLQGFLIL